MTPPAPGNDPSVETQLGVINTKLDILIEQRQDQEARLRSLEQFKWLLMGACIAGGGGAGAIASKLMG